MSVTAGPLFAIPYQPFRGSPEADAERNSRIIEHVLNRPFWFNSGMTDEDRRLSIVWMLTDQTMYKWEIWKGGDFVGIILLDRVVPRVDAVFHFTLWGTSLVSARRLLKSFLAYAFDVFDLQRISIEVPEQNSKFMRFMRSSLGFRLEGELDCKESQLAACLATGKVSGIGGAASVGEAATWLAKFGSRREKAHWDGQRYRDIFLLRLLKAEIEPAPPDDESGAARENGAPHVVGIEGSQVQAVRTG